jgi:hypothetical protein
MYLDSLVESATTNCLFLIQLIVPPIRLNTYPLVNILLYMYVQHYFQYFSYLVTQSISSSATQIPKNAIYLCPMPLMWIWHKPTKKYQCMCNVHSSIYHYIHQTTNHTSIWNIGYVIFFFLCLQTLICR